MHSSGWSTGQGRLYYKCWGVAWLTLAWNALLQGPLSWAARRKVQVPLTNECFFSTRTVDGRNTPDAIFNVQRQEFQLSQNETLFHYAPRSGNDASKPFSLTGLSSLTAQRQRKVSSQSASLQPSLSDCSASTGQLSKRTELTPHYLWSPALMKISCVLYGRVLIKALE